jgi:hypothetical protein
MRSVWIGYNPREADAFAVTRGSLRRHASEPLLAMALSLSGLRKAGLYRRPTSVRNGQLWDDISEAPMSTEFAISRFLVPHLAGQGWALFMDCDMLVRADIARLFALADDRYAVMCVKHDHRPVEDIKMDGQIQTKERDPRFPGVYARKNWSSLVLYNCDHEANRALTVDLVNTVPGRDLHRFCWLDDRHIGGLPLKWNWLAGASAPVRSPAIVHYTLGVPSMPGHEDAPYADEWRAEIGQWLQAA